MLMSLALHRRLHAKARRRQQHQQHQPAALVQGQLAHQVQYPLPRALQCCDRLVPALLLHLL